MTCISQTGTAFLKLDLQGTVRIMILFKCANKLLCTVHYNNIGMMLGLHIIRVQALE